MSRAIFDAPMILPAASVSGEIKNAALLVEPVIGNEDCDRSADRLLGVP
jgi:hypothetical protein